MTKFYIRRADFADIAAINDLIALSLRHLATPSYTHEEIDSAIKYLGKVDPQLIADGTYFVAEIGDRLVGCGGWSKRPDMHTRTDRPFTSHRVVLDPRTQPAKIRTFFVHPAFARRGIGRALMATAESEARQAGYTRLELMATRSGEPLYRATGFQLINRLEVPLPNGIALAVAHMMKTAVADLPLSI